MEPAQTPQRLVQFKTEVNNRLLGADDARIVVVEREVASLFDTSNGRQITELRHKEPITCLCLSSLLSEPVFISGSKDKTIKIWNLLKNTCLYSLAAHTKPVSAVAVGQNLLFSGGQDCLVKIWDLSTVRCLHSVKIDASPTYIIPTEDGSSIIVQSANGAIFNIAISDASLSVIWSSSASSCLALGDGMLYTSSPDHSIITTSLADPETQHSSLIGHSATVRRIRFYQPGLLVSCDGFEVIVWNLMTKTAELRAKGSDFELVETAASGATLIVINGGGVEIILVQEVIKALKVQNAISEADTGANEVFLAHCDLPRLPSEVSSSRRIRHITHLHLQNNVITRLGSGMTKLKALQYLNAQHNKLSSVSSSLSKLTQLESLLLGSNDIAYFPGELGRLSRLDLLDLSQNKLEYLPASIAALRQLTTLFLHDNCLGGTSDAPDGDAIEPLSRSSTSSLLSPRVGPNSSPTASMSSIAVPISSRNLSLKPTISSREVGSPRAAISSARDSSNPKSPRALSASQSSSPLNKSKTSKRAIDQSTEGATDETHSTPTRDKASRTTSSYSTGDEALSPRSPRKGPKGERKKGSSLEGGRRRKKNIAPVDMDLGEYVTTPALKNASLRKSMNRYSTLKISAKYTELAMLEQLAAAEEAALAAAQAGQAQASTPLDGSTSPARVVDGIVREPNSPSESKNGGLSYGLESSPPASSSPLDSPATTPEKEVKSSRDKDKSKVKKKKKGKTTITPKERSSEDPLPSEISADDRASIEGSTTADIAATSSNASTTHERGEANLSSEPSSASAPESNPESPSGSRVPKDASSAIDLQVAPRKESGGLRLAIDKIPARQQSSILPSESNAASTSGDASSSQTILPTFVEVDREEFLKDDNIRTQVYLEDLDFSQLRELRLLHLQANNLESVPKTLGYCTALIDLDLAENRLTEFPLALCELKSLVRLSLASNDISVLPEAFSQLSRLVELYLDENKLGTLPLGISRFQSLRALHVSHNKLRQLPHNFGKLPNLVELNLSHNDLQIFPTELIHLRPLQYLAIDANSLKVLPNDLFYLSSLKSLEARDNLLSNIPYSSLLHLECLQLDNNRIEALPKMIGLLHKISDLSFNGNPLREIPEEIGYLCNLVRLDLSNMPIAQLPESICLLPRLKKLLLQGNDNMTWPDPEQANVLETESLLETMVKDRFGAMKQSSQSRVCFVGLEGSGKSTLFNHLKSGKFQKKIKPTRGIGFETWMPKSEVYEGSKTVSTKMSFNVWDFSGNEDYRILHQLFVSEGAVYVVVWNLALDESRSTIGYWLNTIEAHAGPNAPILIVGTHLDNLKDSEKVMELLERKYYNDRYPSVRGIIAVSSSNGQNIEKVSKKICQLAYDLRRSVMVPASFQKALAAIPKDIPKEGPTPAPIMEIHNFDKFLAKFQIDELQATSALRYLSSVGAVVHLQSLQFDDVVGVITDPAWFVDVYSDIFSQRAKFLRDGILRHETLEQAWKDTGLPSLAHYTLVAVLHKLEMCFDDGSHLQKSSRNFYNNQSKFPSFLPEVPPDVIPWPQLGVGQEEISMAHKFSFIPVSLMPKLMCRLFTRLRPLAFWRHGFVVQSLPDVLQPNAEPEMSAYVEITAKHDLRVWIRGSHMFSCMKLFQAVLLKILASFRQPPSVTLHRHLHCAFKTSMETQVELVAVSMHKVEFEISRGVTVLQLTTGGQIPLTHIHNDMAESISIIP